MDHLYYLWMNDAIGRAVGDRGHSTYWLLFVSTYLSKHIGNSAKNLKYFSYTYWLFTSEVCISFQRNKQIMSRKIQSFFFHMPGQLGHEVTLCMVRVK